MFLYYTLCTSTPIPLSSFLSSRCLSALALSPAMEGGPWACLDSRGRQLGLAGGLRPQSPVAFLPHNSPRILPHGETEKCSALVQIPPLASSGVPQPPGLRPCQKQPGHRPVCGTAMTRSCCSLPIPSVLCVHSSSDQDSPDLSEQLHNDCD